MPEFILSGKDLEKLEKGVADRILGSGLSVKIRNQVIAGLDLKGIIKDIFATIPVPKDGIDGKDAEITEDLISLVTIQVIEKIQPLIKDGVDGRDGRQGEKGAPGKDGRDGESIRGLTGPQGPRGPQGLSGSDGKDGKQGQKGERGQKGEPGKDGKTVSMDELDFDLSKFTTKAEIEKALKKTVKDLELRIKKGLISIPAKYVAGGGLVGQALINNINNTLKQTDWQNGLPGDGTLPLNTNYINFTKDATGVPSGEGIVTWNNNDFTLDINTGLGTTIQVGEEMVVYVRNRSGVAISNGDVTYVTGSYQGRPTVAKANAASHETLFGAIGIATTDIAVDGFGFVADFGAVRDFDTAGFALQVPLWVAAGPGNDGKLTDVKPMFPDYAIQIGQSVFSDATFGAIALKVDNNANDTILNFWNGVFRETFKFLITSNGTTITGSLSPQNGHEDMTMMFSDGFTTLDTTPPKTITLTPGSASVPQLNFVYIPKSTKVLTLSTSDWPTTEHIKVARVVLRTAAITQSDGALGNQNINDHIEDTVSFQGHLPHITERLRQEPAKHDSGVEATASGFPTNVYISTTAGVIYQLHRQTFPAQSMPTDDIHVVNNLANPYATVTNLNTQTLTSTGATLANFSFSFVIWGVQNKTGETSHLMCNLPSGTYAKNAPDLAVSDALNYSNYSIPREFKGTGFLIARFTMVLQADGTTWSLFDTEDLREGAAIGGGGGGGGVTSWAALTDTPSTLSAEGIPRVNTGGTAIDFTTLLKSGATQIAAGAAAGEFWRTSGHATLPDNVILQGV